MPGLSRKSLSGADAPRAASISGKKRPGSRQKGAITEPNPTDQRIRLTGVDWETFQRLAATSRGARFAFDRGVLEILSPGPLHEWRKGHLGEFVRIVTRSMGIPRMALGSTTWGREEADRGIEADECFYFDPDKIEAATAALKRESNDSIDYPSPDLAVEVDLNASRVDRPAIYATINVVEVWRFLDGKVRIELLGEGGTYTKSTTSRFLPVSDADIQRWLIDEDKSDEPAWEERLAAWARRRARPHGPRRPRPAN
jgi:Uma2 family endonuclease